MEKIKYQIDPMNRLTIRKMKAGGAALGRAQVVDGSFAMGKGNALIYQVRSPQGEEARREGFHDVELTGAWSLTRDHDLKLTLDESRTQRLGDRLTLKGAIVAAKADELAFSVTTRGEDGTVRTRLLKLTGRWQADANNRLTFLASKTDGRDDVLTFKGAWEVFNHQKIVYRYVKTALTRKTKLEQAIEFHGHWDITAKDRLSYILSAADDSAFHFTAAIQSPRLVAKDGEIRYRVGIRLGTGREAVRTVTLFGQWRLQKDLSVEFEMDHANGRPSSIRFRALRQFTQGRALIVELADGHGRPLEVSVLFAQHLRF